MGGREASILKAADETLVRVEVAMLSFERIRPSRETLAPETLLEDRSRTDAEAGAPLGCEPV